MNAQAPAATAPVEDPAPVNFHVGLAVDPQCLDWKTITAQLEYALSNRVASGNTIIFHDLTGWWTTRIALLWAVGNGHRVDYTPSEIHRIEHSEIKRLDALHAAGQMHALVVFHNDATSNQYHESSDNVKACIFHAKQLGIPTRVVPYTKLDKEPVPYPHVRIQSGQLRPYGSSFKIGRFYAPKATIETARAWLWSCIEPFGNHFGDFHLESLKVDPDGWWRYEMEREWLD